MIITSQRTYQHNQSAFGQMEVCNQAIQYLKLVSRIDKDAGIVAAFMDPSVLIC